MAVREIWVLSCTCMVFGIVLFVAGAICQYYRIYAEPYKGRAVGRVVELILDRPKVGGSPFRNVYYPVIEFYAEGQLIKVKYPHGSYPSAYRKNQEIKIYFNLDNPRQFRIVRSNPLKNLAFALAAAGMVFMVGGGIGFLVFAVRA